MPPKNSFESNTAPANQGDIEKRIRKEGVSDEFFNTLVELPQSTLNSLLLRLAREKTLQKTPSDLVSEYLSKDETFAIGPFSQHDLVKLEYLQLQAITKSFETVELSPVIPQGINAVVTKISQDVSMVTNRNAEVNGDPTTALALECAKRRKYEKDGVINIATSQRVLRMQPIATKGFSHHFLLLGFCSSGKNYERGDDHFAFLTDYFSLHVNSHLEVLNSLNQNGYDIKNIEVLFSDLSLVEDLIKNTEKDRETVTKNSFNDDFDLFEYLGVDLPKTTESVNDLNQDSLVKFDLVEKLNTFKKIEERILLPLRSKFPNVKFGFELSRKAGFGYYDKTCFHIFGTNKNGTRVQISDGGKVDWVAKMSSDRKEVAITSGMGTEYIHRFFK